MGKRKGAGEGFEVAKAALGSSVERHELSIYDLEPEKVGTFDFVYVGSLLLHLRDPVRGLEAVRSVCTGQLLAVDAIDVGLDHQAADAARRPSRRGGRPWWWKPNLAALRHMVSVAGFRVDRSPPPFVMPPGPGHPHPPMSRRLVANRAGRELALASRLGDPHAAVLASPR